MNCVFAIDNFKVYVPSKFDKCCCKVGVIIFSHMMLGILKVGKPRAKSVVISILKVSSES